MPLLCSVDLSKFFQLLVVVEIVHCTYESLLRQIFGMAEKEMEYRVELFNKWVLLSVSPIAYFTKAIIFSLSVWSSSWIIDMNQFIGAASILSCSLFYICAPVFHLGLKEYAFNTCTNALWLVPSFLGKTSQGWTCFYSLWTVNNRLFLLAVQRHSCSYHIVHDPGGEVKSGMGCDFYSIILNADGIENVQRRNFFKISEKWS